MREIDNECKAEDCISRKSALNTLDNMLNANCSTLKEYHDLLVACFKELIAVTPKSDKPSGKWEQINKNETNVIPQWKCSECGAEFECFDMDFEYCPNCGARMVEEQGENT